MLLNVQGKRLLLQIIREKSMNYYYRTESEMLIHADTFKVLKKFKPASVDMIFADPPYFLSNGGVTCRSGAMVSVNKGKWDTKISIVEKHEFNRKWIRLCKQLLKPSGTVWTSGTFHNIYSLGMALEQEGFHIINNITWQKTNPPPNLACKCFTHSTETILWACIPDERGKKKYTFNYELMKLMNHGKQMKDVWTGSLVKPNEKILGKHPTQKPLYILEQIILASTNEGDLILDPFCGSSSTGVAAKKLHRKYIGIDSELEYVELSKRRLEQVKTNEDF